MTTETPDVAPAPPLVAEGTAYRFVDDEGDLYLVIDGVAEEESTATMVLPVSNDTLAVFADIANQRLTPEEGDDDEPNDGEIAADEPSWGKRMGRRVKKVTTDPAGVKGLLESSSPQSSIKGLDIPTLLVMVVGVISVLLVIGSWIF